MSKVPAAYARHAEGDRSSSREHQSSREPRERVSRLDKHERSMGLSSYYKERFGSQSPEEYQNLRLSHFSKSLASDEIRDVLIHEFERFGSLEVKIVHHPEDQQRLAYVNFQRSGMARKARKYCLNLLSEQLGKHLKMDPAGVVRDQEGRMLDNNKNLQPMHGDTRGARGPPQQMQRGGSGQRASSGQRGSGYEPRFNQGGNSRPRFTGPFPGGLPPRHKPPRPNQDTLDDPLVSSMQTSQSYIVQASRTLFLGNLTYEVTEKDIRRVFERYGKLGGVEIKRPADGATPYAFIFYSTVKQALEAKKIENDRPLRDGQPRVRVGWGKSVPCQRLWVHGLGEWVNEEQLFREFDRYGVIDKVDYAPPADHAYITFDSIQSATDACNAMKNFELGGKDRKIRVDFALPTECEDLKPAGAQRSPVRASKRRRSQSSSRSGRSPRQKMKKRRSGPRTPPDTPPSRNASPGSPPKKTKKRTKHRTPSDSDSAHSSPVRRRARSSSKSHSPAGGGRGETPRDISKSRSPTPELIATTIDQLERIRQPAWTGVLVLKKSSYAVRLYKLHGGDDATFEQRMKDSNREAVKLHITQRLPWAANNLIEKFGDAHDNGAQYYLAVPNNEQSMRVTDLTPKPMGGLVQYLDEKQAAGVVTLCAGATMYVFPKCMLSARVLGRVASKIEIMDTTPVSSLLLAFQP